MKLNLGGQAQAFYIPSDGAAPVTNPSCPFQTNVNMFARCRTYGNIADSLPTYEFMFKKEIVMNNTEDSTFRFSFGTEEVSIINGIEVGIFAAIGIEYTGCKNCWSQPIWNPEQYMPTFSLSEIRGNGLEQNPCKVSNLTISAFPNPFLPVTNIYYTTDKEGTIKIFDALGRLIKSEKVNAGSGRIYFNGSALSAGIYIAQLESNKLTARSKLILAR
ncbi:MAG: T9SS type A sorting domain-containing protein [Fibrobacteres bacterium]|nr:T9SS type A sorting domain-containing protein [Fibrobacterota bacterium]